MDRSFLSQPAVVTASSDFVCIRLISYEDESEKAFVASLKRGQVANTAFAMLTPEGAHAARGRGPGRGPRDLYTDPADMARGMAEIAARYPAKKVEGAPALPINLTPKVGLVVAASDLQPLVLVVADKPERRKGLEALVANLAWSKPFQGFFTYASASSMQELPTIQGTTLTEGVMLIEPDIFGLGGKVVTEIPAAQLETTLPGALHATLQSHVKPQKNRQQRASQGFREGVYYETNIPVSGQGEANDRARYKKRLDAKKEP